MIKLFDRCGKDILEGGLYYKVVKTGLTKTFYHKQKLFSKKQFLTHPFSCVVCLLRKKRYIQLFNLLIIQAI